MRGAIPPSPTTPPWRGAQSKQMDTFPFPFLPKAVIRAGDFACRYPVKAVTNSQLETSTSCLLTLIWYTKLLMLLVARVAANSVVRFLTYGSWVRSTEFWYDGSRSVLHASNEQVTLPPWTGCSSLNYPSHYYYSFSPFWLAHFPTLLRSAASTLSPYGLCAPKADENNTRLKAYLCNM